MRSIIANYIVKEQKMKEFYERQKRQKCKDKECEKCRFDKVCMEEEEGEKNYEKN